MKKQLFILIFFLVSTISAQETLGDLFKRNPNRKLTFRQHAREANRLLKSSDFSFAAYHSMKAIMVKSDYKKAAESLEKSLPNANIHSNRIIQTLERRISNSFDPDDTIMMMNELIDRLQKANELNNNLIFINSSKFKSLKNPNKYFEDFNSRFKDALASLRKFKLDVSEDIYQNAIQLADSDKPEDFFNAHKMMLSINKYVKNYKNSRDLSNSYLNTYNEISAEKIYQKSIKIAESNDREDFLEAHKMILTTKKYINNYKDTNDLAAYYLDKFNELTAEMFYLRGKKFFDNAEGKIDFQKAFYAFDKISDYKKKYKDSDDLKEKSKELGTYKIVYLTIFDSNSKKFNNIHSRIINPNLYKTSGENENINFWLKVSQYDVNHGGLESTLNYIKKNSMFKNVDYFVNFKLNDISTNIEVDSESSGKGKVKIPTSLKGGEPNPFDSRTITLDLFFVNGSVNSYGKIEFIDIKNIENNISISLNEGLVCTMKP